MGKPFAMKITDFGGMIPRRSETLLPGNAAYQAANCHLLSGALRGLRQLLPLEDLNRSPLYQGSTAPQIAYTVGDDASDYVWKPFASADVRMVKAPITHDAHNRYYWTGEGTPKYNTEARIRANNPPLRLGIPQPASAPRVNPATGTPQTARAYVYTFVSPYGEEGPPSNPTVATGGEGAWTISGMATAVPDAGHRAPGTWIKRLYRTVSGDESVMYYFVADIPIGSASFTDNVKSDQVVLNSVLESIDWEPPPAELDLLTVHPSGFLVGAHDTDIYMSVPYRPHAWPQEFVLSTEYPIVGLGIYGNSVVVATTAKPYVLSGSDPLAMTFTKVEDSAPCLSRHGLVSFEFGVAYPSDSGMVLVTGDGVQNITNELVMPDQWKNDYRPQDIFTAVRYDEEYLAYHTSDLGFHFSPKTQGDWSLLEYYSYVDRLMLNQLTGRVCLLSSGILYEWDSPVMPPVMYRWRSKVFDLSRPLNFGAARISFVPYWVGPDIEHEYGDLQDEFNQWRIQFPLAPIGQKMFGDSYEVHAEHHLSQAFIDAHPIIKEHHVVDNLVAQNSDPAAGSCLHGRGMLGIGKLAAIFRVWADERLVFETFVDKEELISMPPGFKAQRWQFEIQSFTRVLHFVVGTSPNALETA